MVGWVLCVFYCCLRRCAAGMALRRRERVSKAGMALTGVGHDVARRRHGIGDSARRVMAWSTGFRGSSWQTRDGDERRVPRDERRVPRRGQGARRCRRVPGRLGARLPAADLDTLITVHRPAGGGPRAAGSHTRPQQARLTGGRGRLRGG